MTSVMQRRLFNRQSQGGGEGLECAGACASVGLSLLFLKINLRSPVQGERRTAEDSGGVVSHGLAKSVIHT